MAQPPSPSDTIETTPDVLTERVDHVLVVTFNRPERMNSIGGDVIGRLSEIFLEAEHDPDVRAIVLTGAGRAFCSGPVRAPGSARCDPREWRNLVATPPGRLAQSL